MGQEQPAKYYDDIFATSKPYNTPEPGVPGGLWEQIAHAALQTKMPAIYDFGCGCGQVCQILYRDGFEGLYRGVDFSPVAIQNSRKRNEKTLNADFEQHDITKMDVGSYILDPLNSVVISTEFLEHVEDDVPFVEQIPAGTRLVFTVPTFDDPGHVRWFNSSQEISDRYGKFMDDLVITYLPEDRCFIFTGVRAGS